jgi:uncharacterized membrane protein
MSYRFDASVTINAPVEVVWNVIQDVDRRVEWDARIQSVQLLTPRPVGKGARTLLHYRMYGMPMRMTIEMIQWQPPLRSAVKGVIVGTRDTIGGSWHFTPNPDGSTTWTTRLSLTSNSRFARWLEPIYGRATHKLTRISQQNFKRLVEAEYAGAARPVDAALVVHDAR